MRLAVAALLMLASQCFAAQPQLKTLQAIWDQYPLTNYPGGSNAVITIYKSTSLGTVWTPYKPTAITPATRTNVFFQVVAPNTFRFYATVSMQPYGESDPSNTVTNSVALMTVKSRVAMSSKPKAAAPAPAPLKTTAPPKKAMLAAKPAKAPAAPTPVLSQPRYVAPFSAESRFGARDPFSPHQYYIKP